MTRKILIFSALAIVFIVGFTIVAAYSTLNHYQAEGTVRLDGPRHRIQVDRDGKGMAYIHAQSIEEALFAQGFIAAQDRIFQMELNRRAARGQLAEIAGESRLPTDIYTRTIGFYRQAQRHAEMLDDRNRAFFQAYVDGVNAYLENMQGEFPLELQYQPEPWKIADSLAVLYLMGWQSAANINHEIIMQGLIEKVGGERARELYPVNVNPDDLFFEAARDDVATTPTEETAPGEEGLEIDDSGGVAHGIDLLQDEKLLTLLSHSARTHEVGSNNWAVSAPRSPNLAPVVANDPHLSANTLPGPLYPSGLRGPGFRVVGAGVAGIPGMVIGRNEHIAIGATNAYGDTQDLYVETVDPQNEDHYLEGGESIPFDVRTETIRIKDDRAPGGEREQELQIRSTSRGPVVSGALPGLNSDKVITLRWSAFETMGPDLGLDVLFHAEDEDEIRERLSHVTTIALNFVFADRRGGFGLQTTGRIPIRTTGDGTIPVEVTDGQDNWSGYIPFEEMPRRSNVERGWVGTANHKVVSPDYPYYYSSYFSPYYRYERMTQVLDGDEQVSIDEHWALQRDIKNLMAERLAPIMAEALAAHEDTEHLAGALRDWDYMDRKSGVAPTIFQSVYRHFAQRVFEDELGEELTSTMLGTYYFWQVRLEKMVTEGDSPWFDNVLTEGVVETRDDLFHLAALDTIQEMAPRYLNDPREWIWGRVHQMRFINPIRPRGFLSGWLGGGSHPMDGSGETLYRAIYDFNDPYNTYASAALRMVADLGDTEKVLAVMPSGVSGRTFDDHFTDQVDEYMDGDRLYWWFSDEAIEHHSEATLILDPIN